MRMQLKNHLAFALLLLACAPDGGARFTPARDDDATTAVPADSEPVPSDSEPGPPPDLPSGPSEPDPTEGAAAGPLVPAHATWRYRSLGEPAPADWRALGFADDTWPEGQAPFGEDADATTVISPADAPVGLRLRRRFQADAPGPALLRLHLRRGDGAAVYLNGVELARSNLADAPLPDDALAQVDLAGNEALRYVPLAAPAAPLLVGENVVAVELRRHAVGGSGLGFDLQLEVWDLADADPAALAAQLRTVGYGGKYGDRHVFAAWIERAGLEVRTLAVYGQARREHLIRWRAAADDDPGDAMTGATRKAHGTLSLRWDLRDRGGQPVAPGSYALLVEFTEDNSNDGAPPGPVLSVPFTIEGAAHVVDTPSHERFDDLLLVAP
jgi:hypothetical protein